MTFQSEPPSATMTRGGILEVVVLSPSGSGTKYRYDGGIEFWSKEQDALVEWKGQSFQCTTRKS
ncbi:MliC family protein [Beijerinckia indica]|uniref:MliC family protein n=1 Tax=Beijerinckia indica TaxID=533 RepID=UPI003CC74162